jgi:hypothetical protein
MYRAEDLVLGKEVGDKGQILYQQSPCEKGIKSMI